MQLNLRKSLLDFLLSSLTQLERSLQARRQRRRMRLRASSTRLGEFITEIPVSAEVPSQQTLQPIASRLTPSDIEAIQIAEQTVQAMAERSPFTAIEIPEEHPEPTPEEMNRSQRVVALLDEGWNQGLTTYPQLIAYVKTHSGQGCSKRVIANWKRDRGLMAA